MLKSNTCGARASGFWALDRDDDDAKLFSMYRRRASMLWMDRFNSWNVAARVGGWSEFGELGVTALRLAGGVLGWLDFFSAFAAGDCGDGLDLGWCSGAHFLSQALELRGA